MFKQPIETMVGDSQGSIGALGIWPLAAELLAYSGLSAPSSHNPQTAFDSSQLERQKCLFRVSSPLWLPGLWEKDRGELLGWMTVAAPSEKKKDSLLL